MPENNCRSDCSDCPFKAVELKLVNEDEKADWCMRCGALKTIADSPDGTYVVESVTWPEEAKCR
jgi:hypothetical protein